MSPLEVTFWTSFGLSLVYSNITLTLSAITREDGGSNGVCVVIGHLIFSHSALERLEMKVNTGSLCKVNKNFPLHTESDPWFRQLPHLSLYSFPNASICGLGFSVAKIQVLKGPR